MARHRIFSTGIVWDPREPLPAELQSGYGYPPYGPYGRQPATSHWDTASPYFDGNIQLKAISLPADDPHVGPPGRHLPGQQVQLGLGGPHALQAAAATLPVPGPRRKNLPRFTVQEQDRNLLPPLSVKVDASIVQDTARVAVTQLFWNDASIPIKEAAFTFPLPAGCTVTDFSCRIGPNKIIKGTVKPREEARQEFKRHIRTHDTAAGLLEQDTPEIFTTTLGNVPEKTKVKVNLTYITVLKHRFADNRNVTTLTIPTSIAPRYGDAPDEYNGADTTNVPQGLTLEVEVVESERITSIASPSHVIEVNRRRGPRNAESFADLAGEGGRSNVETAAVALPSGSMPLDKDFVLDIETAPDGNRENPQAWLEEHPTLPNHKAIMLTLPPEFLTNTASPFQRSEILFLADCSGSMEDKIVSLKSAMRFFLKGIPEGRKFNIWCFGDHHISWQPHSVEYAESTLNSALSWVEQSFSANMGGTELLPALEAIVQARDRTLMTDVIVLTDGEVWYLDDTLDYIQKTRDLTESRVRFFALGIGHAVSHALVDGIAKAGGGYAEVVQEASQGGWEDRVVSMAKAALLSAHLGPLHLEFSIQDKNGNTKSTTLADAKRSPADISNIGPFDRNRVYFLSESVAESESITSVKLEIEANQETKSLIIPVTVLEKRDTMLHKLAARSMLDDLERNRSHIHLGPSRLYPGTWRERNMVRKEAEEIACKWSLVSKWTSFFLAEEPYTAAEKDPFMDGVVEVSDAPGDDLLEPRLDTQRIGILESAESNLTPSQSELSWSWSAQRMSRFGDTTSVLSGSPPPRFAVTNSSGPPLDVSITRDFTWQSDLPSGDEDANMLDEPCGYTETRGTTRYKTGHSQGCFGAAPAPPAHAPIIKSPRSHDANANFTVTPVVPQGRVILEVSAVGKADKHGLICSALRRARSVPKVADLPFQSTTNASSIDIDGYKEQHKQGLEGRRRGPVEDPPVIMPTMGASSPSNPPTLVQDWEQEDAGRYLRGKAVREIVTDYRDLDAGEMPSDTDMESDNSKTKSSAGPPFPSQKRPRLKSDIPDEPTESDGSNTSRQASPLITAFRSPPPDATLALLPALGDQGLPDDNPLRNPRNQRSESPSPEMSDKAPDEEVAIRTDKEFVSLILGYQLYNGAIDFGSWMTASKYLGEKIIDALRDVQTTWLKVRPRMLWTAAICVLLERDLRSCKPLWELMAMKMERYCRNMFAVSESGPRLYEDIREKLEGLKLPFHQEKGQEDAGSRGDANTIAMETAAPEPQVKEVEMDDAHSQPQPEVDDDSDVVDQAGEF